VALFRAAGVGGWRRRHALVSRSTEGIRALMRGRGSRAGFSMPLRPQEAAPAVDASALEELAEVERSKIGQVRSPHAARNGHRAGGFRRGRRGSRTRVRWGAVPARSVARL
jgi:hypothetical protein